MTRGPLPQAEFEAIFAKVPRLTVELVVEGAAGVLLTKRASGPCAGLWHLPGGTVRYGEPLTEAVARVGADELGVRVRAVEQLGYLEYPSHLAAGIDWPVGMAFSCELDGQLAAREDQGFFADPPQPMHDEQVAFLQGHGYLTGAS